MQKVAFFDIDGTVFRSSLLIRLVDELVAAQVFPTDAVKGYASAYEAWQNREGTYEAYMEAVIRVYLTHIKGIHYGTVADIGRMVVAENSHRVYRYTRDLIASLKRDGYYLVAISQSPKSILDEFCREYGFDKVYGRMYEIGPTDRFTGEVEEVHLIENKANIVHRVFDSGSFTEDGSVAVGDTEGDVPMLELVERPICFNPNKVLYEVAKHRSWNIVVERKDVIYSF
jgi:HAD superfamily hydrolase (TIGR01490 family)